MRRVGILTFWGVPNCGAFAQAYALRNAVSEICNSREVFQIAYLSEIHKNFYNINDNTAEEADKKRNDMFIACYDQIPHINVRETWELLSDEPIDTLILGSDIIWDFSLFGNDPFLFGNKINADYKFSYAPSFGACKSEWRRIPQYVTEGLLGLDAISVRDNNSVQIVKNISGRKAEPVLDPVWLWDWNHDGNIIEPKIENYIFVYGGGNFSKEFQADLRNWAVEHDCVIIAYGSRKDDRSWCDMALDTTSVTPFEVVGYFKKARFVATSAFHGMMFSLIFGKKAAYYKTDFVEAKIHDFLCDIGIWEKYLNKDDVYNMYETEWDYERIHSVIERKKDVSLKYLIQNLRRISNV